MIPVRALRSPRISACLLAALTVSALLMPAPAVAQTAQAPAQQQAAPAQPPQPACADAEKSHQFDFWIGEWDVYAGGSKVGDNSIQPILDGCVLQEKWLGASGSAGSSFNFYNPQTGKWHQFWVWRAGTVLDLSGGLVDGKMTLEGMAKGADGKEALNRITWTPNADGSVRQHWQVSPDGGKTWTTSFDGLYKKKS